MAKVLTLARNKVQALFYMKAGPSCYLNAQLVCIYVFMYLYIYFQSTRICFPSTGQSSCLDLINPHKLISAERAALSAWLSGEEDLRLKSSPARGKTPGLSNLRLGRGDSGLGEFQSNV